MSDVMSDVMSDECDVMNDLKTMIVRTVMDETRHLQ